MNKFELMALQYLYDALEPIISRDTSVSTTENSC